jgi:hypothetical protein
VDREDMTAPEGPGRGRLSRSPGSRVLGCEPVERGEGIVPDAQAGNTVAHAPTAAPPVHADLLQSHSLMPFLSEPHL